MVPTADHLTDGDKGGQDQAAPAPVNEGRHSDSSAPRSLLASMPDDPQRSPTIANQAPPVLEVAEHSPLNKPGADTVSLAGVSVTGAAQDGTVTVTVSVDDPALGTLNGSSAPLSFTGTEAEANAWLQNLQFQSARDNEIGTDAKQAVITVRVDAGNQFKETTLTVDINPTNSPVEFQDGQGNAIDSATSSVVEGSVTTLDASLLNAVDREVKAGSQSPDQIIYQIDAESQYGYLILTANAGDLTGKRLGAGSIFTHQDVLDGKVKYVHTAKGDAQNLADSFTLRANDGATPLDQSA